MPVETMIMTSSALLHPTHRAHTSPLGSPCASPSSSPRLRPVPGAQHIAPLPNNASAAAPAASPAAAQGQRSYARKPQIRPYANRSFRVKDVEGDTKAFANALVSIVQERSTASRLGRLSVDDSARADAHPQGVDVPSTTSSPRKGRSLGPSLAGSWENERVELLVDIPVWSPGCFQDLSTLHALRDTTLSHVHSLLAYMLKEHQIPASYRILARSAMPSSPSASPRTLSLGPARDGYIGAGGSGAASPGASSTSGQSQFSPSSGWGCIRLAPSIHCNARDHSPLRPAVRRSSLVGSPPKGTRRRSSTHTSHPALAGAGAHPFSARHRASSSRTSTGTERGGPAVSLAPKAGGSGSSASAMKLVVEDFAEAVADEDVEEYDGRQSVRLLPGYSSASSSRGGSDDEDEAESADWLVGREIERRGAKEGEAFLMKLFGQPALILC